VPAPILAVVTSVLVVGGGPAGRALAAECAALGCATLLVDRAPAAPWRATYGAWLDELPAGLPPPAATAEGVVIAHTTHALGRTYAVLDVPAMRAHLDGRLAAGGVGIVAGRVTGRTGSAVHLADGTCLRADVIVDAGGHRAPLRHTDQHDADLGDADLGDADLGDADWPTAHGRRSGGPETDEPVAAEQTAYGVVVDAAVAAPLVEPGAALFMDWRPDHGEPGWPTFLYAVPLGGGAVLLEETSLARRPGLPLPLLRRRLLARLAHHGIAPPGDARTEGVRFPVDRPRHTTPGVLGFGAAAPLVHPATGFSVADALSLAPAVASALASGGVPAARRLVWSPQARAVHRLRRIGLEAMLRMPPEAVPDFFETFFTLPERHRRSYLSGRDDLPGMLAAMGALFVRADARLRWRLVGPAVRPPAPALST
jgi:lycopene beta-cyclase